MFGLRDLNIATKPLKEYVYQKKVHQDLVVVNGQECSPLSTKKKGKKRFYY